MRNPFLLFPLIQAAIFFSSCAADSPGQIQVPAEGKEYVFTFTEAETALWKADFADYQVGEEDFYELKSEYSTVPEEAGETKPALKISGNNHNDHLFMYLYRPLKGLEPETTYQLSFQAEFASNAPRNSVGIGGSPGASVYLKVGALPYQPKRILEKGEGATFWKTNFDKGNKNEAGADMLLLGNTGTDLAEFRYTYVQRSSRLPFTATSSKDGVLWLVIGTESGFKGTSTLYYTTVKVNAIKTDSTTVESTLAGNKALEKSFGFAFTD